MSNKQSRRHDCPRTVARVSQITMRGVCTGGTSNSVQHWGRSPLISRCVARQEDGTVVSPVAWDRLWGVCSDGLGMIAGCGVGVKGEVVRVGCGW